MVKLDLAAAASIMTASTPFKQYAIAAGATWPVQASNPDYKALADGYSAAKKEVIANGPKTINEPTPKATKAPKGKKAAVSFKPTKATNKKDAAKAPKAKAPEVTLTDSEREAIEAEVRSHTVRPCGCGCGVETKASFLPGHDAKLRSALIAAAKARKAKK